jgi:alpha-tubulin suppressor-like RCC1 family protein
VFQFQLVNKNKQIILFNIKNKIVSSNIPIPVDTSLNLNGLKILQLSIGDVHSCCIASDENVYCWGDNK